MHQATYFDVRIFNPFAQSYGNSSMSKCHRKDELDKKREYEEQIRGLMFTFGILYSWGYGPNSNHSYKRIASLITDKRQEPYSTTLLFGCDANMCFSLLCSAIMCFQGSRSFHFHSEYQSILLICAEAKVH